MDLISLNRDFYNTFAADFSESRETINKGIQRSLTKCDLTRLIDIGCGDGRVSRLLPPPAYYVGADFSPNLLGRAASHGSFVLANMASALPFTSHTFSTVTCFAALHHLPERTAPLRELARLLQPKGRLIISLWQFTHLERFRKKIVRDLGNSDYVLSWDRGGHGERYVHEVTAEEIKRLASETSLSIEEMFYADGKTDDLSLYVILKEAR